MCQDAREFTRTCHPNLQIRLEKDNEAVLMFVTVDADELQLAQSPAAAGTTTTSSSKSSTTEGLHVILEHAGKSEPLFLFYRNGQLKSKVYGANLPKITANIYEHAVANPEVDDIEVRMSGGAIRERMCSLRLACTARGGLLAQVVIG